MGLISLFVDTKMGQKVAEKRVFEVVSGSFMAYLSELRYCFVALKMGVYMFICGWLRGGLFLNYGGALQVILLLLYI
jgi:hypothetical protein